MKQLRFFFILMAWVCIHTAWGQVGTSSDPLYGKRIGVIGDSYVRNHREPVEYTWHYKFAKKHGMQYFNYKSNGKEGKVHCDLVFSKMPEPFVSHVVFDLSKECTETK